MFFDQNRIKLELQNRKILGKSSNIWKIYKAMLNYEWLKKDSKGKTGKVF